MELRQRLRINGKSVDEVTTADVLRILSPIWSTKHETARRLRHRISAVMKWAVAEGHRGDNPAGDAIGAALPRGSGRVEHHKAFPHAEVAAALEKVQASEAALATKLCIRFLVLTACRKRRREIMEGWGHYLS